MTGDPLAEEMPLTLEAFSGLSSRDMTATIISRGVQYFVKKQNVDTTMTTPHTITHWIVTDLQTAAGRQLLVHALDQMVCCSYLM